MHQIVAYTFLIVCEKVHQFLPSIKKDAHKRKLVPFFCLTVYNSVAKTRLRGNAAVSIHCATPLQSNDT